MTTIIAPASSPGRSRRGFTLVELLISLVVAMAVLTASTNFGMKSWQARRGWTVKESVDRNARFVGLSLARDAQEAGIAMESTPVFASLATFGDSVSILGVPYAPNEALVHPIWNDGGVDPDYPPGGTCGANCIDFMKTGGGYTLAGGQLARLQVGTERRLLFLTSVSNVSSTRFRIRFLPVPRFLGRESGLDSLLLSRSNTSIQQVTAVVYWRDATTKSLMRAQTFNGSGQPVGYPLATNVEDFDASLLFTDGGEATAYDGFDADTTNDGNKIIGVRVRARLKADRVDPSVNGGAPYYRWYDWQIAPRNLLYEKNRMG